MAAVARARESEGRRRASLQRDLTAGDRILGGAKVVVASQAGRAGPRTSAAVHRRTVTGTPGSVAAGFPRLPSPAIVMYVTAQELVATRGIDEPHIVWRISVERVVGVRKSPRLQVMARFRITFDDGSSLVLLTLRARTVALIRDWLSRRP